MKSLFEKLQNAGFKPKINSAGSVSIQFEDGTSLAYTKNNSLIRTRNSRGRWETEGKEKYFSTLYRGMKYAFTLKNGKSTSWSEVEAFAKMISFKAKENNHEGNY